MPGKRVDVVVVGAGPAGMAAAIAAAQSGAIVGVVDDNPQPGGQIWRGVPHDRRHRLALSALEHERITVWSRSRVVAVLASRTLLLECDEQPRIVQYGSLVLATGARERLLPFPGWELPQVMGLGGLQALIKAGFDVRGRRIAVLGTGPLLVAVAATAAKHGAVIELVGEQAPRSAVARFGFGLLAHPQKLSQALGMLRPKWLTRFACGVWPSRVLGTDRVEALEVQRANGRTTTIDCDLVACAYGLVPNLELARLLGCACSNDGIEVDTTLSTSVPSVFACGEATGIAGLEAALVEGRLAGHMAAGDSDRAATWQAAVRRHSRFATAMDRAFALRDELRSMARPDTIVCRCEDVRLDQLVGHPSWRAAKLHTRCGMGLCQGRVCGAATQFLFGTENLSVRPPLFPASVAVLASASIPVDATAHVSS